MKNVHFLMIGDPKGKRINSFIKCLRDLEIHNYKIISWIDLLKDLSILTKSLKENTIIKLEPPEKDMQVYSEFLKNGESANLLTKKQIEKLDFSKFPIIAPKQWYEGFKNLLQDIEKISEGHRDKNVFYMHDFKETAMMMDKEKTYEVLQNKQQQYEFALPEKIKTPINYDEFKERHKDQFISCFIKLRYGSGGTGVLAYRNNPKLQKETVHTSLNFEEFQNKKIFYSNNKVNVYQDSYKIQELINWVLGNGAHIEKWIPKSTYEGKNFDTRVFVLNKKSNYFLSRLSKTPITNLHLKNERIETEKICSKESINILSKATEDVMKVFHSSFYAGIDVVFTKNNRPYIIDVNPFGDLFYHLIGKRQNVYYLQIEEALGRLGGVR